MREYEVYKDGEMIAIIYGGWEADARRRNPKYADESIYKLVGGWYIG